MSPSAFLGVFKTSLFLSLGFNKVLILQHGTSSRETVGRNHLGARAFRDQPDDVKEYHNKTVTRIFCGNARLGHYFLTLCIFSAGMLRDHLCVDSSFFFSFSPLFLLDPRTKPAIYATHRHPLRYLNAPLEQPHAHILPAPLDILIPVALFVLGQTFVVTSTWALGITSTFL